MDRMHKEITFFKINLFVSRANFNILLNNAKKHNVDLTMYDSQTNAEHVLPDIQDMYDIISKNPPLNLIVNKERLKARLEIRDIAIKLYPEPPLQVKLHRDEEVPSVDYVAYLQLLIKLCKDLEIDALGTKENLFDYLGPA